MRFLGSQPEAEGLLLRSLVEKGREVARVVDVGDPLVGRFQGDLIPRMTSGVALFELHRPPVDPLPDSRPPAFSGEAHEIPAFLQQPGIELPLLREKGVVIAGFFQLPGVAPREQAGPRGSTLRIAVVGIGEKDSLPRNSIKTRSFHVGASVGTEAVPGSVVGDDKEDVRTLLREPLGQRQRSEGKNQQAKQE